MFFCLTVQMNFVNQHGLARVRRWALDAQALSSCVTPDSRAAKKGLSLDVGPETAMRVREPDTQPCSAAKLGKDTAALPVWAYRPELMDLRTRPVDDERCPECGSCVLEYYGAVEITGPPYRIERIFGRSCGNPDCHWQEKP